MLAYPVMAATTRPTSSGTPPSCECTNVLHLEDGRAGHGRDRQQEREARRGIAVLDRHRRQQGDARPRHPRHQRQRLRRADDQGVPHRNLIEGLHVLGGPFLYASTSATAIMAPAIT